MAGGAVAYVVDANLGTHLTGATRDEAQAHAERRRVELATREAAARKLEVVE